MQFPAQSQRGFTAFEVLIGITILGMVGGLFVQGFRAWNRRNAVTYATQDLRTTLRLAQGRSVSVVSATSHGVFIDAANGRFVEFSGYAYNPASTSVTEHILGGGAAFGTVSLAGTTSTILFQAFTGQTANAGAITIGSLTDPSVSSTIVIDPLGFITSL